MSHKVEAWILIGKDGRTTHFHSKPSATECSGGKLVRLVPFDPDAARVLKAADKFVSGFDWRRDEPGHRANNAARGRLFKAVERRQKRGAK